MDFHSPLTLSFFFLLLLLLPTTQASTFAQPLPTTTLAKSTQKLTKLHFYFHDKPNGPNPTSVIIARPPNQTTIGFGTLVMIDDLLTEGPETGSRLVGRAQGMYAESSQRGSGKYSGSTISILGRYPVPLSEREMPVVGGSGAFRFARGYALAKTYKYDPKTGVAVSEYNVFVLHFDNPLFE
ncbi:hypothetical protein Cgig2_021740 [Carnegiea gigantea]|uniref:Dirigent protein n=1 Tax=Carnegiea gigantea TaxID=171969 RepID=A0A9Q1QBQ5_9CARY|nr:hypothetical protein Cgig2_021740 [Carnegiea gigantea]